MYDFHNQNDLISIYFSNKGKGIMHANFDLVCSVIVGLLRKCIKNKRKDYYTKNH